MLKMRFLHIFWQKKSCNQKIAASYNAGSNYLFKITFLVEISLLSLIFTK